MDEWVNANGDMNVTFGMGAGGKNKTQNASSATNNPPS